eukprot:COSAG02_NODE_62955_length_264_cov_0.939394_1_plen_52_part_10
MGATDDNIYTALWTHTGCDANAAPRAVFEAVLSVVHDRSWAMGTIGVTVPSP